MLHIGKYLGYIAHGALKVVFYPFRARKYIKNKDNYPIKERYDFVNNRASEVLFKIMRVKLDVIGLEKLNPNETYLFTPNHQGMLDAVCMLYLLKEPAVFVSKKEIRKFPIVGKLNYMIDAIFLDREKPRDALNMVHDCNKYLNESRNVVIFPEGTRSKDKDVTIHTYKPGAFKCAYKTGAKIVPIVIDKSYLPLSVKRKNTDKIVKVRILDPINPSEYENISTNELALMVENKAKSELEVLRNEDK